MLNHPSGGNIHQVNPPDGPNPQPVTIGHQAMQVLMGDPVPA